MVSSAASWPKKLSKTMRDLGISSCLTDPGVWICAATNPDGYNYWEYILVHSGDLIVISHHAKPVMKGFDTSYTIKPDTDGRKWAEPTTYLGAGIAKFQVPDTGETCWIMSGNTYIKNVIKNIDLELSKSGWQLFKIARSPIKPGYQTEIYVSPVLEGDQVNYYHTTVGQMR